MKRFNVFVVFILIMVFVCVSPSFAQCKKCKGNCSLAGESSYNKLFDVKKITITKGKVESFDRNASIKGLPCIMYFTIKTDKGSLPVHLGPDWFVKSIDFPIKKGDAVNVNGSMIIYEGKPAIMAITLKRGMDIFKLRNEKGVPLWKQ